VLESGIVSEDKNKPLFDEQTLARLLEAAFVLQEHGHQLRKHEADAAPKAAAIPPKEETVEAAKRARDVPSPEPAPPRLSPRTPSGGEDYSSALAEIVEAKHEIEVRHLNSQDALSLIANRLIGVTGARGAAIALLKGNVVSYRTVAGISTLAAGSEVPLQKALCASAVRSGEVFTCADVTPQLASDVGEYRQRGIRSLIVVPVGQETDFAGAIEGYYSDSRSFTEQDVNTCQLFAGMVGEVLAAAKPVPDSAVPTRDRGVHSEEITAPVPDTEQVSIFSANQAASALCSNCGQKLVEEEQFCGECGAPRPKLPQPTGPPNKAVPYWLEIRNKQAQVPTLETPIKFGDDTPLAKASRDESKEHAASEAARAAGFETSTIRELEAVERAISAETRETETGNALESGPESTSIEEEPGAAPDWSSALSARQFLEQIAAGNRKSALVQFWNSRRGDVYLAIAIIVVILVIGFGLRSGRPVKATPPPSTTAASHKPAQPDLSLFDRMLISLGLAEAPPPPEEKGNPTVQVWIDLHTGLYYCPGADLYGKTLLGKYATQRDAELDQYQPAYRKTCE